MSPARRSAEETEELRASLLKVAQRIVSRDGASALTMRSLATEAGCSVGLPYKVFDGRGELVVELIHAEFVRLGTEFDRLIADAGTRTVGENLGRYAEILLTSPAVGLGGEIAGDEALSRIVDVRAGESGLVHGLDATVRHYLEAEKALGRISADVDVHAFGFLISAAVHNLLVSGEMYPHPTFSELKAILGAIADHLRPPPDQEHTHA